MNSFKKRFSFIILFLVCTPLATLLTFAPLIIEETAQKIEATFFTSFPQLIDRTLLLYPTKHLLDGTIQALENMQNYRLSVWL